MFRNLLNFIKRRFFGKYIRKQPAPFVVVPGKEPGRINIKFDTQFLRGLISFARKIDPIGTAFYDELVAAVFTANSAVIENDKNFFDELYVLLGRDKERFRETLWLLRICIYKTIDQPVAVQFRTIYEPYLTKVNKEPDRPSFITRKIAPKTFMEKLEKRYHNLMADKDWWW